jgi:hypothetical protein
MSNAKQNLLDLSEEEFNKRFPYPVQAETKEDRSLCVFPGCSKKHPGKGSSYRCEDHEDEMIGKPDWMCYFDQCQADVVKGTYYCDEHPNGENNEFDHELFRCHKCRVVNHYDSGRTTGDDGNEYCGICMPCHNEE